MKLQNAYEIIKALSQGVNPYTGEIFPLDNPYQHPNTVRALFQALEAMEYQKQKIKKQKSLPDRSGKPWTEKEDDFLVKNFDKNISINELEKIHKRTRGSITARLVKLEKITEKVFFKHEPLKTS